MRLEKETMVHQKEKDKMTDSDKPYGEALKLYANPDKIIETNG